MELLKRAQSEFLLNAIGETYCKLDCANLLEQPTPITTLSNELKLQKDALSRFLNAAAFLGMCQRSEDETYQHLTIKQFDKALSPTLFHLVTSDVLASTQLDIAFLKGSEKALIEKACDYGLLIKTNNQVSIPPSLVKYYNQNSSQYIGPLMMHYKRIMYPMYSCEGILSALKTGTSQWQQFFGRSITSQFEAYQSEPELLETFTAALHRMNLDDNTALLSHIEIKPDAQILDLGGGSGALACCVADKSTSCQIDIYELEEAIPMFNRIRGVNSGHQCISYIPGDFKLDTPNGELQNLDKRSYDAVFLSWILHDWNDETCINILKKVKRHLNNSGTIFILESLLPENKIGRECLLDIAMLLQTEGRERTFGEYEYLLNKAGFRSVEKTTSSGRRHIIRAKK